MISRYQKSYDLSGFHAGMKDPPRKKREPNPWADALRFAGSAAPLVGGVMGGAAGTALGAIGGPAGMLGGAATGAGLGLAAGNAATGLANAGADALEREGMDAEAQRLADDEERRARQLASLQLLGQLG